MGWPFSPYMQLQVSSGENEDSTPSSQLSRAATRTVLVLPAEPEAQGRREQAGQPPPAPGPTGHQGHSHGPQGGGGANITWMVLLGDGLHNLTDGLAIGARGGEGGRQGLEGGSQEVGERRERWWPCPPGRAFPQTGDLQPCRPQVPPSPTASPVASAPP